MGRCDAFEQAAKGELQSIDLRLGATLTISDYLMPDLMADFLQIQPQAHLQLQVGNTRQMIEAVNQFQLDLALIEGSVTCRNCNVFTGVTMNWPSAVHQMILWRS